MKKIVVVALICMMLFALTACSEGGGSSDSKGKFEIVESAYLVDKDSGDYSIVVIAENSSEIPIKEAFCIEAGFDEDGKKLSSKDTSAAAPFRWLCEGEKEAFVYNTSESGPGDSLLDHYESLPDRLEWKVTQTRADPDLTPLGISVVDCATVEDYDTGADYEITFKNDSEKDYLYDAASMMYQTEAEDFSVEAVAVFRDSEGNIRDAVQMKPRPNMQKDLPANSETVLRCYSNHVCRDDDLSPEYYLYVSNFQ